MPDDREQGPTWTTSELGGLDWRTAARFSALIPGELFAERYRIRSRLGHGATGEVFLCDDELAGDDCAVKVIYPGPQRPPLERLRRELRLMRKVGHPGIVQVHDIGEAEGLLYLVMEYLKGETLASRLRREGRLPPARAEPIVRAILQALDAAHEAGVVHRDVKPANVLLTDDGERVVLLDFGLAWHSVEPTLTRTGGILGTPQYMSPEQASGSGEVGPASDLYAAGIVLWEMLAGAPPFDAASTMEVLTGHVKRQLPAPRKILRHAPEALRSLATALLEKKPVDRPSSARDALILLDRSPWRLRVRRTFRALTRGGSPARRLAAFVLALPMIAAAVLYPARGGHNDATAYIENVFGMRIWSREFDRPVADVRPFPSPDLSLPRFAVTLGHANRPRTPYPDAFPSGHILIDPIRRQEHPLQFRNLDFRSIPPLPGYDAVYGAGPLTLLPWRRSGGRPEYSSLYEHRGHYPSALILTDDRGTVRLMVQHPGAFSSSIGARADEGGQSGWLVVGAQNNLLGQRAVVFGLYGDRSGSLSVPPFTGPWLGPDRANWYTFLDAPVRPSIRITDDSIVATAEDLTVRLDLLSGVPLDEPYRAGLSTEEWREDRRTLTGALQQAGIQQYADRATEAAQNLDRLAASGLRWPAHRAIAYARAAELYRLAEDFVRATSMAERAQALEPIVPGHLRLRIDGLTRQGNWSELAAAGDQAAINDPAARRDLILAELLHGDAGSARRLSDTWPEADAYYRVLCVATIALHKGDPDAALAAVTALDLDQRYNWPELRFLAFAAAVLQADFDPVRARTFVDDEDVADGNGIVFPLSAFRALLALRSGQDLAGAQQAVREELQKQRVAATEHVFDLYLLGWGEVLFEALFDHPLDPPIESPVLQRAVEQARSSPFASLLRSRIPVHE